MSGALPNPVRVSPLIRLGRWTFLILGIMYGSARHKSLTEKEKVIRAIEEAERPAKERAEKAEKDRIYREELAYLNSIGVTIGDAGPSTGGSGSTGSGGTGGDSGQCEFKF